MASEKKDKQIHIKVSGGDLTEIANRAASVGKTVSAYLLELGLAGSKCTRCHGSGLDPKGGRR